MDSIDPKIEIQALSAVRSTTYKAPTKHWERGSCPQTSAEASCWNRQGPLSWGIGPSGAARNPVCFQLLQVPAKTYWDGLAIAFASTKETGTNRKWYSAAAG